MRIGEFMKRISAIAEQLDFNCVCELIILAAFRKWIGANKTNDNPSFLKRFISVAFCRLGLILYHGANHAFMMSI